MRRSSEREGEGGYCWAVGEIDNNDKDNLSNQLNLILLVFRAVAHCGRYPLFADGGDFMFHMNAAM